MGLTLGSGEVSLLELVQGYAMLARHGFKCKAYPFQNKELQTHREQNEIQIISPEICFLITDILSDEDLRIQAFGLNNPLLLGFPMAIKTGTSEDWRDNWVVGYTEDYTIGVWAGNFEGVPMNQVSGSIGAGPLFNKIATLVVTRGSNPVPPAFSAPSEEDVYIIEPGYDLATQTLQLNGEVDPPQSSVTWMIDGKPVAAVSWPYTANWQLKQGRHSVLLVSGEKKSDPVHFEVR